MADPHIKTEYFFIRFIATDILLFLENHDVIEVSMHKYIYYFLDFFHRTVQKQNKTKLAYACVRVKRGAVI